MGTVGKGIVVVGCFDTKAEDFSYLLGRIESHGHRVITIDAGAMESRADFHVDFDNVRVALASGTPIGDIRGSNDRGRAVELMGKGASAIVSELVSQGLVEGIVGMGGGGGTYIALEAMQGVPMGIPKLCLSTLAARDLSRQIGVKDITLMVSSVDVAGLNSISMLLMDHAAAAICGMADVVPEALGTSQKSIAISMFGNTTKCVEKCTELLKARGYEVLAFHATGTGGATMESLIREGVFDGVLDVTTTELADELCGGVLSAGPGRLTAASEMGVPQVVVPGCLDMVNFSQMGTVPERYRSRQLYGWSPDVTLMRTDRAENVELGRLLAQKLDSATAAAAVLIPLKGISQLDSEGDIFHDPGADAALFSAIREHLREDVPVMEVDAHINDVAFARALVDHLVGMLEQQKE